MEGKELPAVKEDCFETIQTRESSLPERTAEQISKLIVEQHLSLIHISEPTRPY